MAAYHVTQEDMEERINMELTDRVIKGGDICAALILELDNADVEAGTLTLSHHTSAYAANPAGNIHGGIITWLMDSAMGILSRSYTGYESTVTLDIHVSFLKAVRQDEDLKITAYIVKAGRTTINIRSEITVNGELRAAAESIFFRVA